MYFQSEHEQHTNSVMKLFLLPLKNIYFDIRLNLTCAKSREKFKSGDVVKSYWLIELFIHLITCPIACPYLFLIYLFIYFTSFLSIKIIDLIN